MKPLSFYLKIKTYTKVSKSNKCFAVMEIFRVASGVPENENNGSDNYDF